MNTIEASPPDQLVQGVAQVQAARQPLSPPEPALLVSEPGKRQRTPRTGFLSLRVRPMIACAVLFAACVQEPVPDNGQECAGCDEEPNAECAQDYAGHDACRVANDDTYFCGPDLECIPHSMCEALECCLPGEQGDAWCEATFGEGSVCIAGTEGSCS